MHVSFFCVLFKIVYIISLIHIIQQKRRPIEAALNCDQRPVLQYFVEEVKMNLKQLDDVTRRKILRLIGGKPRGHLVYEYGMDW